MVEFYLNQYVTHETGTFLRLPHFIFTETPSSSKDEAKLFQVSCVVLYFMHAHLTISQLRPIYSSISHRFKYYVLIYLFEHLVTFY